MRLEPGGAKGLVDGVAVAQRLAATLPVEALFLDQTHPSARLNEAVAEALASQIAPWLRARGAVTESRRAVVGALPGLTIAARAAGARRGSA